MNKRCASSITGNWEDDHSILKTDNKEHLLGWRVYCPRARYPSATRHPPLLFPRKINICWGLVIIGYTARVRPRVCVQLYTCLWLSWHMLVATFHQTRPECDGAAQKSRVFWQQPVRLWWNTPGRWLSMGSKNKMGLISVLRKEWTFRSMEMFLILTPSKSCDFWSDKMSYPDRVLKRRNIQNTHCLITFYVPLSITIFCMHAQLKISDIFTSFHRDRMFQKAESTTPTCPATPWRRRGWRRTGPSPDPVILSSSHPHRRLRL